MNLGDLVKWSSQAAGTMKKKQGEIIEVVPANSLPKTQLRGASVLSRKHESYVVHVGSGKGMRSCYWPLVSGLSLVTPTSDMRPEPVASPAWVGGGAS